MSEAELIARIRELFPRAGDDGAVIGRQVITNDMLVEEIDFTRAVPLRFIARKSIAVNISDLAAMGARPTFALVAIATPPWVNASELVTEIAAAAREHRIEVVGGDLSRSDKLVISVTALGETDRPLLRSGARAGERIYVSRPLGGSPAGLFLLQHGWTIDGAHESGDRSYAEREFAASAIRRHVDPEPEIALGLGLSEIPQVTSCIDISDGLSTDIHNLCNASEVGAMLERERIPLFSELRSIGARLGIDVQEAVLHGGEEYALLFTSTLRESELSTRLKRPVYAIGRVTKERGVTLDGIPLEAKGWDHFA